MLLRKLFEPISIKCLEIKNRVIMPAMHINQGNMEEGINDAAIDFYTSRAKGNFGMIGVGVIDTYFVSGASSPNAFFLMNKKHVRRYEVLTKNVKAYGAVIYGQIGVRRIFNVSDLHKLPKLSTLPKEEIAKMIDSLINTAVLVRSAGFDAVEILGIGGGAVSLFLSNVFNDRLDEWGGSLEKRLRFPTQVLKGIRKRLGDEYPLFFRFHGSEFIRGGYSIEAEKSIAQSLEKEGVDLFNVSGGGHGTHVPGLAPAMPRGGLAFLAREVKSAVNVPVAASNRINHPVVAEEILRKGWGDFVSVGRGSLADPEWPQKAQSGRFDDIRLCIACNECLDTVVIHEKPVRCTVNPRVGRVSEIDVLPRANTKKRVLIVGGGCSGLQAALTCRERGHDVCVIEKEVFVGGKWRLAAIPPGREELINFIHWLLHQVLKAGIEIRTNTEFTSELARELKPDVIIVCSGSRQPVPDIRGVHLPNVVTAEEVLEGSARLGNKVVVVGGGGVGTGTALYLAKRWSCSHEVAAFLADFDALEKGEIQSLLEKGHQVTLVEQLDKVGQGIGPSTKWVIRKELELSGVEMIVNSRVKEITTESVIVDRKGVEQVIRADTVVLATGFVPDSSVYEKAKDSAPEVYVTGMAVKTGHTIEGIGNAFEVAMSI